MRFLFSAKTLLLVLMVALAGSLWPVGSLQAHPALADIHTVRLVIEDLDHDAAKLHIQEQAIREIVENDLHAAGIGVADSKSLPELHVRVAVVKGFFSWAVSYRLFIQNWAHPDINPRSRFFVTTWQKGGLFSTSKRKARIRFEQNLGQTLDDFVEDYRTAHSG